MQVLSLQEKTCLQGWQVYSSLASLLQALRDFPDESEFPCFWGFRTACGRLSENPVAGIFCQLWIPSLIMNWMISAGIVTGTVCVVGFS